VELAKEKQSFFMHG